MKEHSDEKGGMEVLRGKIIGLGDLSIKKSYYPQLQKRLTELEKFRALMDQTSEGIIAIEMPSGRIMEINTSACFHLNCSKNEMHNLSIFERQTTFALKIVEFIESNDPEKSLEIKLKNSACEYIIVEANLKKIEVAENSYVLILTRDISRRKHLQEEKETLIAISKIFLNTESSDNIYGRLLPLLMDRLGFSLISLELHEPESDTFNIIGISGFMDLSFRERVLRNKETITDKVFSSGQPVVWKGDLKLSGIFHPILENAQVNTVVCVPMISDTRVMGAILFATPYIRNDIDSVFQTVQVVANHLAQEIKRKITEEKLVESNRDLRDFADRVSHNLRNGLSIISGYISIINEEPVLISEYYNKIDCQLNKISRFVDRVIELSLASSRTGEKTTVDLNSLVESTYKKYSSVISSQLIVSSPLPLIFADHQSLKKVFDNLFSNSFKYYDENKDVLIVNITYQITGDSIIISFRDNGSGLSDRDIKRIFNIGMSGKPGETTGFGLSIVKKIIESLGGAVRASSEGKGTGTEIRIILPDVLVPGQNIQ